MKFRTILVARNGASCVMISIRLPVQEEVYTVVLLIVGHFVLSVELVWWVLYKL